MIRKFGIALITLTFLWSSTVFSALEALEEVAELAVSGIRLPASGAGQVIYRKCTGCEPTLWQVDAATTYHVGIGTAPVPLGDLRQAVGSDQYELIYVFYVPNSDAVTRIVLDLNQATDKYNEE